MLLRQGDGPRQADIERGKTGSDHGIATQRPQASPGLQFKSRDIKVGVGPAQDGIVIGPRHQSGTVSLAHAVVGNIKGHVSGEGITA